MIGIVLRGVNIRAEMNTTSQDMGDLFIGDLIIGTVLNGWIAFDGVYRKSINYIRENLPTTRYAAVVDPSNTATKFIVLIDAIAPTPAPAPVPTPAILNISIGGDEYQTVNVELKPK